MLISLTVSICVCSPDSWMCSMEGLNVEFIMSICLSVGLASRTPSLSIIGWLLPVPRTSAWTSLDSVPLVLGVYVFPSMMMWSLPFPPSEIRPGSLLLQEHLARLLYLFFLYAPSPPVSAYSADPPSVWSLHRPSVGKLPTFRIWSTKCPLLFSRPSVPYAGLHPPPPDLCGWWYLAWVWVGGQRRRRPPRWY